MGSLFSEKLIHEFTKRIEFTRYTRCIFKNPLNQILKVEQLLNLDGI